MRMKRIKMILPAPLPREALDLFAEQIPSRLKIPVVGAAMSAFCLAIQLGQRFSILTMYEPWRRDLVEVVRRYGLSASLASVRSIDVRPDTRELLSGKEDVVFGALETAARAAIKEDGADVIVIGSTTMYQSHTYLASVLPCPVINPGLAAYRVCENLIDLDLAHSKIAYPSPEVVRDSLFDQIAKSF
jgi:allantoin racemase